MKKLVFILIAICALTKATAQTGIGTTTPNASAKLDVFATDKGFLPPRVNLTASNVFAPLTGTSSQATGLLIYNLTSAGTAPNNVVPGYYYWNGSKWVQIASGIALDNKTSDFNITSADNNKIIVATSSSALTVNVLGELPVGFSCQVIQGGAGQITLTSSAVNLKSANGFKTRSTNSIIGLVMNTTSNGFVFGDSVF